jgi:hypothetical protein
MDTSLLKYGIIAVDPEQFINTPEFNVLHLVGYENEPDAGSYQELYNELRNGELKGVDFILVPALPQILEDAKSNMDDFNFEVHGDGDAEDS